MSVRYLDLPELVHALRVYDDYITFNDWLYAMGYKSPEDLRNVLTESEAEKEITTMEDEYSDFLSDNDLIGE